MITAQIMGVKLPTCTYCGTAAVGPITAAGTTFAGQSIGAEDLSRYIVVGIVSITTAAVSSVTVGGVSATFLYRAGAAGSGTLPVEFWAVSIPTGTTASVVVTTPTSLTFFRCSITVWALYKLRSTSPVGSSSTGSSPGAVTLTTSNKGVILALAQNNVNGGTFSWSESGQDYQTNVTGGGILTRSGYHAVTGGGSTSLTVTYSSASSPALLAASWR